MDREKVIKGLEQFKADFKPFCGNSSDWARVDDALALLKEQEPVKPVVDIDTWKCGNCGHTLERQELLGDNVLFYEQYKFCPGCGRAVKWK